MKRAVVIASTVFLARCGSCKSNAAPDAGTSANASASAPTGPAATPAPLSLPMAADHDAAGNVYVAGFVSARSAVNLSRFDDHARLVWSVDAISALGFSSDAHVDVVAGQDGANVIWRGLQNKKRVRITQWVAADGNVTGGPAAVGASACSTAGFLYAIGGKLGSSALVRPMHGGNDKSLVTIPEGHDPVLVCGEGTRAYIVDDGDDDIGVRLLDPEKDHALPRAALVPLDTLGGDEVREHEDFSTGDTLHELVVTEKGVLSLHQYDGTTVAPRRALETPINADEDLMAADGNATHVVAIIAREATARCDGDMGTDVLALDVPSDASSKEQVTQIAQAPCGRDLGPYWVAPTPDAVYLAWNVRGPRNGSRAPVEALQWTKLGGAVTEVKVSAEDIVFAGCAKAKCMFATLARPEGTDGMTPGEARITTIP
jgi:hypothetical protein